MITAFGFEAGRAVFPQRNDLLGIREPRQREKGNGQCGERGDSMCGHGRAPCHTIFAARKKAPQSGACSLVVVDLGNRCQPTKSVTRTKIVCGWSVGGLAASG
jgi:hypothetical protein